MYGYIHSHFPRASSTADFPAHSYLYADGAAESHQMSFQLPPPHHIVPDHLAGAEFDSLRAALSSDQYNTSPSGCSSYGSPSYTTHPTPYLMQRSASSHSLPKNCFHQLISPSHRSESGGPVRRVFSTGDLQRVKGVHYQRSESPLSNENSIIFESMNRATKYSPEEKKERIDRYRIKRHQRNFNKKIKYACRKTLADSRPRIRGRFARNDEIETNPQSQWSNIGGEEDEDDDENWIHFLDAFSANLLP